MTAAALQQKATSDLLSAPHNGKLSVLQTYVEAIHTFTRTMAVKGVDGCN